MNDFVYILKAVGHISLLSAYTQASVDPKSNFRLVSVTAHKKTSKVLYLCLYLLRQMVSCCILQKGSADHHEKKKKYKLSKKKCVHTFCCIKYSINTESMYVGPCVSMRGNKYYIEGKRFSRQRDGETDTYRNTCTKVWFWFTLKRPSISRTYPLYDIADDDSLLDVNSTRNTLWFEPGLFQRIKIFNSEKNLQCDSNQMNTQVFDPRNCIKNSSLLDLFVS